MIDLSRRQLLAGAAAETTGRLKKGRPFFANSAFPKLDIHALASF
jgi:hypothetical protein